ncbi:MAG: SufS family cysteine desulfurase [Patescibacteria group bacterium]|nr:SufS family cysteine desulfurase [Patescibacteria group bacterium]
MQKAIIWPPYLLPILSRKTRGRPLVYLDSAATTQKPYEVISAVSDFYAEHNANTRRGIHELSEEATELYEKTRDIVKNFLRAKHREEIIFTSGTTEGLNLLAFGLAGELGRGDEILLTEAEHHSNIVPWQIVAKERHLKIKFAPVKADGRLDLNAYKKLLNRRTKIVSITHASNVTGAITPLDKLVPAAHKIGALIIVDAAQSVAHLPLNVQKLDCDFLVFSGHKLYGPTGVGVLYGKKRLLEKLTPRRYGGQMIEQVKKNKTTLAELPARLEGGTMPIAEIVGLGEAINFLRNFGWQKIKTHDQGLCEYGLKRLSTIPDLRLLGPTDFKNRLPIFSFTISGIPAHDLATLLDEAGIAVRAGHHCAEVLHTALHVLVSARASCALYTSRADIDALIERLLEIKAIFHG